jgi:hypothetical protein
LLAMESSARPMDGIKSNAPIARKDNVRFM